MEKELKEIIEDVIQNEKAFHPFARMYSNDPDKAQEFVRMVYEQSHVQYLRENYGEGLMKKIEKYCEKN